MFWDNVENHKNLRTLGTIFAKFQNRQCKKYFVGKVSEHFSLLHTIRITSFDRVAYTKIVAKKTQLELHYFQSNKAHEEPLSLEKVNMTPFREEKRRKEKGRKRKEIEENRRIEKGTRR